MQSNRAFQPNTDPTASAAVAGEGRRRTGASRAQEPLLEVAGLSVSYQTDAGLLAAVHSVDLSIARGEIVGLVGESGCGKSATALAILRVIDPPHRVSGDIRLRDRNLSELSEHELRRVRGRDIAVIYQEPASALNPVLPVGYQVREAVLENERMSRSEANRRVHELFDAVGIADADRRAKQYPHNLSGGLKQRVMIAMALAGDPALLIADEPTTALDVTIQAQILELIKELSATRNMAVLFITHDLGVVAQLADRVAVMYAGEIVEQATVEELILRPRHPYSAALLRSVPSRAQLGTRLTAIPGSLPNPLDRPAGCAFADRCTHTMSVCRDRHPVTSELAGGHAVRCWLVPQEKAAE